MSDTRGLSSLLVAVSGGGGPGKPVFGRDNDQRRCVIFSILFTNVPRVSQYQIHADSVFDPVQGFTVKLYSVRVVIIMALN